MWGPGGGPAGAAPGTTLIEVCRRGDASVVRRNLSSAPLGLRELNRTGAHARVALVQTSAMLVSGDDVVLDVRVGHGASLELMEISGTVAHPVAGGPAASMRIAIELGVGARLLWNGQPLIVAAGADVKRLTRVALSAGARMLMRDVLVLGRHAERSGAIVTDTRVERESRPVLHETLDLSDPAIHSTEALLGHARVIDSLALFGWRLTEPPADAFRLGDEDTLLRRLVSRACDSDLDAAMATWRDGVVPGGS